MGFNSWDHQYLVNFHRWAGHIARLPRDRVVSQLVRLHDRRYRQAHEALTPTHTQGHNRRVGNFPRWDDVLSKADPDWKVSALEREAWREQEESFVTASAKYVWQMARTRSMKRRMIPEYCISAKRPKAHV